MPFLTLAECVIPDAYQKRISFQTFNRFTPFKSFQSFECHFNGA
jgi:hypothetical protein